MAITPTDHNSLASLATEWTQEEQRILEDCLTRYPDDKYGMVHRYVKIAFMLPEKGVRDVALRVRWMDEMRRGGKKFVPYDYTIRTEKRGAAYGLHPTKAKKRRAEAAFDTEQEALTNRLLDDNAFVIDQIRQNILHGHFHENAMLMSRFHDNIQEVLKLLTMMPGILSQMPPLPTKLNKALLSPENSYPASV